MNHVGKIITVQGVDSKGLTWYPLTGSSTFQIPPYVTSAPVFKVAPESTGYGNYSAASNQIIMATCQVIANASTLSIYQDLSVMISSAGMSSIRYSCNGAAPATFMSGGSPALNTGTTYLNVGKLQPAGSFSCQITAIPIGDSSQVVNCSAPNPISISVQK